MFAVLAPNLTFQYRDFLLNFVIVFLIRPITLFPVVGVVVTGPMKYLGQTTGAVASVSDLMLKAFDHFLTVLTGPVGKPICLSLG